MEKQKIITSSKIAQKIWQNREFYRFENFPVSEILKIYVALFSKDSITSRMNHYKSFLSYFSKRPIKSLTHIELKQWFLVIQQEAHLTERTLAQVKSQLNGLFKWLEYEKIIDTNPLNKIIFKRSQKPSRARIIFNETNLEKLLSDAKEYNSKTFYPFLFAIVQTGARRSEVAKLRMEDVDIENNQISFKDTKNGESRRLYIQQSLKKVIINQNVKSGYVFNYKNKILSRGKMQRLINEFKEKYPAHGDWNYHDLRHSFAFNFLTIGGEMYQLQAILGHKTIQMTVDLYGNYKSQNIKNPSPYKF